MRKIKFRAWIKVSQKMASWEMIKEKKNLHRLIENQDYLLMQYSGLKDKNGIEIYEGDIVAFDNNGFYDRGVVVYDAPCFIVDGFFLVDGSIEIIGNIYENPDLLKG